MSIKYDMHHITRDLLDGVTDSKYNYLNVIRTIKKKGYKVGDRFTADDLGLPGSTVSWRAGHSVDRVSDFIYKIVDREPVKIKCESYYGADEEKEVTRYIYELTKSPEEVAEIIAGDIIKAILD